MGAKVISYSQDNITYKTLPGNSGDLQVDGKQIDDTVFGQNFASNHPGLITWQVTTNSIYKGFAGYVAQLYQPGVTTVFTDEATTLVAGSTYKITAATKSMWDRSVAVVVKDAAADHTADVAEIDYLFGTVTFRAGYVVTGPVTVTGSYFPTTVLGTAQTFQLKMTAAMIDKTDFALAQANGGFSVHSTGLIKVELQLDGFYDVTNAFETALQNRTELILGINPDGGGTTVARGFFKPSNRKQSGNVGALEQESITFMLTVPTSSATTTNAGANAAPQSVFGWNFGTGANALQAVVQNILNDFLAGNAGYVKYLPNGAAGYQGGCQIADCTLKGGLEAMNEFNVTFQGSGALTAV